MLKAGDRVDCRILANKIVSPYSDNYDCVKTFEIVSLDTWGYFIYIPQYVLIENSMKIDSSYSRALAIDSKFIGENMVYIKESLIYKISSLFDGCICCKCHEFYDFAAPNQENGTMICWSCRNYPYY